MVSSEGFNQALGDGQNVHFTPQEYRDFGKRYAEKMIEVLGDKIKPAAASSSSAEPESSSSAVASSSSVVAPKSSSSVVAPPSSAVEESSSSTIAIGVAPVVTAHIGKAVVNASRVTVPVKVDGASISAKVFSMQGKMVLDFSNSYVGGALGFDTAKLPAGSYMLSVQVGSERSVQKVQVK